jgi:hypothetical protein
MKKRGYGLFFVFVTVYVTGIKSPVWKKRVSILLFCGDIPIPMIAAVLAVMVLQNRGTEKNDAPETGEIIPGIYAIS